MTEWIVSNAWWFAPSLAFAGVGMFVGALLWPRKATNRHQPYRLSEMIANSPGTQFVD